jgi:hypothetical protein
VLVSVMLPVRMTARVCTVVRLLPCAGGPSFASDGAPPAPPAAWSVATVAVDAFWAPPPLQAPTNAIAASSPATTTPRLAVTRIAPTRSPAPKVSM